MNYIRHLNAFFSVVRNDTRLTSSHVSLYLALFQYWNFNRFQNPFPVYRENIMQLSKIGSKNTYHKCMKQLHHAQYIIHHPAVSKYQPVKISMIRLDTKEQPTSYKQLDLFSTNNETTHVPLLTTTSPGNGTKHVPFSGHPIKPNIKHRETHSFEIFKSNEKIQENINDSGHVSNLVHIPLLQEVQAYFTERKYPTEEATKFFSHYKSLGWKIQGKTAIEDWKPLVEKWMQNAKNWGNKTQQPTKTIEDEINYLYQCFIEGKKILHLITTAHFDHLKLQLDEEVLRKAWQERINQVSGTNQHSLIELWKAYLTNEPSNPLIQKDKPIVISIAKRLAVLNNFKEQPNL